MERYATTHAYFNPAYNGGPPAPQAPCLEPDWPGAPKPEWKLVNSFVAVKTRQKPGDHKMEEETTYTLFWFWENVTPPKPL